MSESWGTIPAPPGYAPLTAGVIAVCVVFPLLAAITVALRFWVRRTHRIPLRADDWTILPALLLTIATCGCGIWGAVGGRVGSHDEWDTEDQVVEWLKAVYYLQVLYICALPLIKLSILLFYNRIFPTRRFRIFSYCVGAFLLCWWIAFEFSTIFQCLPIAANWQLGYATIPLCINEYVMYDIYSATNLFTDILILAMPWPIIAKLQMGRRKKIQLLGVFLLGSFICIAGIVHLVYVILLDAAWTEADSTHYQGYIFIWFSIEPCTGVICACLPTLSPIFIQTDLVGRLASTIKNLFPSSSLLLRSRQSSHQSLDEVFIYPEEHALTKIPDAKTATLAIDRIPMQDLEGQRVHHGLGNESAVSTRGYGQGHGAQ